MTDFLFIYEHVNRDIENNVLVMNELEQRGYRCDLISFYGPDYVKWRLLCKKARVVVVPWLRFDEDLFRFAALAKKPYIIVNEQCEQVSSKMSSNGLKVQSELCKKAYFLCWGNQRKEDLITDGVDPLNISVTGAVQLDYGREEFKRYYLSKSQIAKKNHLDIKKRWIIFISSFSTVSWTSNDVDNFCKGYGDFFREYQKISLASYESILGWIEKFCSENDCEFIYRPHPSETNTAKLRELDEKIDNFHIISEYSVKQWGKVCESVNLWISTSNAELYSMGVNYNVIRPYKVPNEYDISTFIGEDYITSYEQFEECLLNDEYNKKLHDTFRNKVFKKYYSFNDNIPSYKRIADSLEEIYNNCLKAFTFRLDKRQRKKYRKILLKDILKSGIIFIDTIFPQINVFSKLKLPDSSINLLRTRCNNYAGKNKAILRMRRYISRYILLYKKI